MCIICHDFKWSDVPNLLDIDTFNIPPSLRDRIHQDTNAIRMEKARRLATSEDTPVAAPRPSWPPGEWTIFFEYLPQTVSKIELIDLASSFGKVSNGEVHHDGSYSTGYIRMEEKDTCEWVMSYFRGMPYDDASQPVETGFVNRLE